MRAFSGHLAIAGLLTATLFFAGCTKKDELPTQQQVQQPSTASPESTPAGQPPPANAQASPASSPGQGASTSGTPRAQANSRPGNPPANGWGSTPGKTQPSTPAPPPPPRQFTLDAGTSIPVRTVTALSTKTAAPGDPFEATLTRDLVVDDYVVAARGSTVTGKVTDSDPGGKVKGLASISVALTSITSAGGPIAIHTQPVGQVAKTSKKKDAAKIGIGAGIGAAIGAIAGGGKGAAIGAGIGGAGGTGVVLATKGNAAVIPSESVLTFRLSAPVTVTEKR
ncbi:hypothetical protein [uncultured Paludibaculum sp.]|uniref:hypothetical protein n=1 Tax=uncultured Paludibaculum sp. TaxID=1765020 RepID=UPI002AAAEA70|nr:hypothetical protein [uncultured Paludibaculum sp.]